MPVLRPTPTTALLVSIPSAELVNLAALAGIGMVLLDVEHGYPVDRTLPGVVTAARAAGARCLVRVPPVAAPNIGSMFDLGIDGVVLSGARSIAEIDAVYRHATFPPKGRRSVNPFVAAAGRPGDIKTLQARVDEDAVWAMAETVELLPDLERAARGEAERPHCAGLLIGPYDLAAALGYPAELTPPPPLVSAVARYAAVAAELGLHVGLFVRDMAAFRSWQERGLHPDLVVLGYDRDVWYSECFDRVTALSAALAESPDALHQQVGNRSPGAATMPRRPLSE